MHHIPFILCIQFNTQCILTDFNRVVIIKTTYNCKYDGIWHINFSLPLQSSITTCICYSSISRNVSLLFLDLYWQTTSTSTSSGSPLVAGTPLTIRVQSLLDLEGVGCSDFSYICVQVDVGSMPMPPFNLDLEVPDANIACAPVDCRGEKLALSVIAYYIPYRKIVALGVYTTRKWIVLL